MVLKWDSWFKVLSFDGLQPLLLVSTRGRKVLVCAVGGNYYMGPGHTPLSPPSSCTSFFQVSHLICVVGICQADTQRDQPSVYNVVQYTTVQTAASKQTRELNRLQYGHSVTFTNVVFAAEPLCWFSWHRRVVGGFLSTPCSHFISILNNLKDVAHYDMCNWMQTWHALWRCGESY